MPTGSPGEGVDGTTCTIHCAVNIAFAIYHQLSAPSKMF
jgi:hypothetical protein